MARAAVWLAIVFLLGLNLLQFSVTNDVVIGVEAAQNDARKAVNAGVAASDAQFRAQELTRALGELEKALLELKSTLGSLTQKVDGMPDMIKKEALDEAKALIPPPTPAVDEDLLRSSILTIVHERLDDELGVRQAAFAQLEGRVKDEVARLEKRLLTEMKDKKDQSFHVKQPLPVDEPTEPASPTLPEEVPPL